MQQFKLLLTREIKTFWDHPLVPVSPHCWKWSIQPTLFQTSVVMTTVTQFWLCNLSCSHFWMQHQTGITWAEAAHWPILSSSLISSIYSSTSLSSSAQWRGLLRVAVRPEQTHHTRFHLPRPTLTHKLPANRPPPIALLLFSLLPPLPVILSTTLSGSSFLPSLSPSFSTCSLHYSSLSTSLFTCAFAFLPLSVLCSCNFPL